jgi:hypothetical protein
VIPLAVLAIPSRSMNISPLMRGAFVQTLGE